MVSDRLAANWRRVVLAAVRLAGLYVIGVVLMLLPFMLLPGGGIPAFRELARLAAPAGILFAVAFLLLAIARRAGFVALWLLLAGLWTLVLVVRELPIDVMIGFVGWTVLAFPLHVLGALGVPSALRVRLGRASLRATTAAMILWAVLLIPAVVVLYTSSFVAHPLDEAAAYRMAGLVAPFVWGPAPFLIAALSLAHVWTGTARAGTTSQRQ